MSGPLAPKLGRVVTDDEMVLIEFTPPWTGNRAIIGLATGIKYGYGRKAGERFNVHQADIDLQPNLYKPVSQTSQVLVDEGEKEPLPPPKPLVPEIFYPADLAVRFGLNETQAHAMIAAGFTNTEAILEGNLTKVKGIGKATEKKIKAELKG